MPENLEPDKQMWTIATESVAQALRMKYFGPMLNERYLHHFLSRLLQRANPLLDLTAPADMLQLHPEWPTFKKETGICCGRYRFHDKKYMPDPDGGPGWVDFALGEYRSPAIGIEMSLKGGWSHEEVVYDFMKLLDIRNPFRGVISLNVLLRPNGLSKGGRKDWLRQRIMDAHEEALGRLQTLLCPAERQRALLVSEVAPHESRHWYWDADAQDVIDGTDLPPVLRN
jgi:hypothetical protein